VPLHAAFAMAPSPRPARLQATTPSVFAVSYFDQITMLIAHIGT